MGLNFFWKLSEYLSTYVAGGLGGLGIIMKDHR